MLGTLLLVVGVLWLLLGLGNLVGMFARQPGEGIVLFGFMLNMVLFVLPGLLCAAIGQHLRGKAAAATARARVERPICPLCREAVDSQATVCPHCREHMVPLRAI